MSNLKSALELAENHPAQFLSEYVFKGLRVDEFKFGPGTSGHLGMNMISQYVVVPAQTHDGALRPVPGGNELAIHLNCFVKASNASDDTINIHVEQFHITARSVATQKLIDAHGASAITAENSIHMNVNTGWGRAENLKALAEEIEINKDQTLREVQSKQGYNNAYVRMLVKEFRVSVTHRVQQLLGGQVKVNWEGDKTFPSE